MRRNPARLREGSLWLSGLVLLGIGYHSLCREKPGTALRGEGSGQPPVAASAGANADPGLGTGLRLSGHRSDRLAHSRLSGSAENSSSSSKPSASLKTEPPDDLPTPEGDALFSEGPDTQLGSSALSRLTRQALSTTDADAPSAVSVPQFRPMPPQALHSGGPVEPVSLEFSSHQQLPAVLAAVPAGQDPLSLPGNSPAEAVEAGIAAEFVEAVSSASAPVPEAVAELSGPQADQERRWDEAQQLADEQYRALVGQDMFQKRSLEAAILKLQAPVIPAEETVP